MLGRTRFSINPPRGLSRFVRTLCKYQFTPHGQAIALIESEPESDLLQYLRLASALPS